MENIWKTEDCLQLQALPLLSLGAVAYSCYNKDVPLFTTDGHCAICLGSLGNAPADLLSCGHVPWNFCGKTFEIAKSPEQKTAVRPSVFCRSLQVLKSQIQKLGGSVQAFHCTCIQDWLALKDRCPICREDRKVVLQYQEAQTRCFTFWFLTAVTLLLYPLIKQFR